MARARQTLERRQLGLALRRIREESGKSQQAAAEAIGRVRSRIVELEDGKGTLSREDLVKLLDFYGISGDERETVVALGAQARKRQRGRTYTDLLPGAFQRFADLEASATEIKSCESGIIPGLLQAPSYINAVFDEADGAWWGAEDPERGQRVAFRLERQARTLNHDTTKSLHFVVSEEVLHAKVGVPDVMREQLAHILHLTNSRNDLVVQVLRHDAQNPTRGGGLTVFGFGHRGTPVGFSTTLFGPSTYYQDTTDIAIMSRVFDHIRASALSARASLRLIEQILEGME
ncbi:helix-turn-helix domain-containing protein [Saccharopolyspora pogona]|uniref:helix-turn-helix domain-containing protein n=1 Tax=Saccharopolyspora pogona TaxID=333966 RepID=UPI0016831F82|nr:helix-turn-helix transcriptional regulator [Saccharopolyspora pogona]